MEFSTKPFVKPGFLGPALYIVARFDEEANPRNIVSPVDAATVNWYLSHNGWNGAKTEWRWAELTEAPKDFFAKLAGADAVGKPLNARIRQLEDILRNAQTEIGRAFAS